MGAVFAVALARIAGSETAGSHETGSETAGTPDTAPLPGERVALVAGAGEPLAELCARLDEANGGTPALTLLVGSERAGLPDDLVERMRARRPHPDRRRRVAQRGDGRDRGAV